MEADVFPPDWAVCALVVALVGEDGLELDIKAQVREERRKRNVQAYCEKTNVLLCFLKENAIDNAAQ